MQEPQHGRTRALGSVTLGCKVHVFRTCNNEAGYFAAARLNKGGGGLE